MQVQLQNYRKIQKLNLEYNSTGVKSESTIRNLQSPAAQICAMYKITDIIREVKILITESSSVSAPKAETAKRARQFRAKKTATDKDFSHIRILYQYTTNLYIK